ncbi:MAG: sugar ABC transporter permease [Clostridia bacterium]|nr:sugar ABC transporter permease [Clostridia bacterium]MBR1684868.1 sugar ABC transporter permease [Clostridia bacterium]MBR2287665.1 sugar ABC transporter permease [Clostridia bacterium]
MAAKKSVSAYRKSQRKTAILFLLPNLVGFLLFVVYPVFRAAIISLTNWNGFKQMDFVGVRNYVSLFSDSTFIISLQNTLIYTIVTVPLSIAFGIVMALLMNLKIPGIKVFRTIYFLPQITSMIAIGLVWSLVLAKYGPLNQILMALGNSDPPKWISSTKYALTSVEIVSIWRSMGYNAIIILAGLQGIDAVLYEAAKLDGANAWQSFVHVTIPMLSPTIFFCLVTQMISSFKVFDIIIAMTQGGPGRATNVLAYFVYNKSFVDSRFGYASAAAFIMFAIIMFFTAIQFYGQKKWVNY